MTAFRAPIVLGATALGLAATLGFNAHQGQSATTPSASAAAPASSSSATSTPASPSSSSSSSPSSQTVTSDAVGTPYGNLQLKVTIANGKVTNIEPVALPANDPKSQAINAYAEPMLQQSALTKQDGTVDAVSGATYTSNGYLTALQSALDKAGFPTASTSAAS
jgi:uncharacterized protein with FMN-binding domain